VLSRPEACCGCVLDSNPRTQGFVPPTGPLTSPILLFGEAAGEDEARTGLPFVGAAGSLLNRLLSRNHQQRDSFRIGNTISCRPPNNWFDERAPYYRDALAHCARHREPLLAEGHPVVMALGGTALKTLLHLDKARVEDWHGTVTRDPSNRFWVVPTFHTSHLQRGAMNLFGVSSFDLQVALRVAAEGFEQETPDILVDPPPDWFEMWVQQIESIVATDSLGLWLAVDIETPDKIGGRDEGDLTSEDASYTIVRVNFSVHPDEGLTVPYAGPYIALCERLFALACPKIVWSSYDEPRIRAAGHTLAGDWYDFMWAWHRLQSDVPRGLGFVAPFYSRFGAWKHLASSQPGYYAACDGFQTYRVGTGIANDLMSLGMWDTFARHTHATYKLALKPAQAMGVKIDRQRLVVFIEDLAVKQRRLLHEMQGLVPDEVRPLTPKGGLKRAPEEGAVHTKGRAETKQGKAKKEAPDPIKQDLYAQVAVVVPRTVQATVLTCTGCGIADVPRRHRCAVEGDRASIDVPRLVLSEVSVTRWYWQEPFNPDSPDQILAYLKFRGHKPGRAKKTGHDSTDRETLERLIRDTKDPLYRAILDSRAVGKVRGTYGLRTLKLMDQDDRVHPVPTDRPSTGRRSYVDPNITNVITDRGGPENLAAGFRKCVIADLEDTPGWKRAPALVRGSRLFEIDFSGIEGVLTGWFSRDAQYIWLAKLGVHGGLASHILKRPYNPDWADADISAYFKQIKHTEDVIYDRAKHTVHGINYGLTIYGMVRNFPQSFPNLRIAKHYHDIYAAMAPALGQFQGDIRQIAYDLNYLGGALPPVSYSNAVAQVFARNPGLKVHPFGYKHWFWSVIGYRKIPYALYLKRQRNHEAVAEIGGQYFAVVLGDDAKRAVAFFPQSTAAGVLTEVMLRLFDPDNPSYIGDAYYGRTPLRAPIHDSLLMEIPCRVWDQVVESAYREMLRPIPELSLDWISPADRTKYGLGRLLTIGVEGKAGSSWAEMEVLPTPTPQELGVSQDGTFFVHEEADEEEEWSLGTSVA
jgi:uracil-DNA glycosylase